MLLALVGPLEENDEEDEDDDENDETDAEVEKEDLVAIEEGSTRRGFAANAKAAVDGAQPLPRTLVVLDPGLSSSSSMGVSDEPTPIPLPLAEVLLPLPLHKPRGVWHLRHLYLLGPKFVSRPFALHGMQLHIPPPSVTPSAAGSASAGRCALALRSAK